MSEPSKFEELIQRVREGDQDAATQLVQDYEPAIRRIVRLKTGDSRLGAAFDSMDICQSVMASFFVRAAAGQYELDSASQLLNLLAKMAQNKLAMQVRKQRAKRRDNRRAISADASDHDVAGDASTPSQQFAAREMLQQVRQRLSTNERALVEFRQDGLSWQEIGEKLNASPEALRKKLTRAIDRVAEELEISELLSN